MKSPENDAVITMLYCMDADIMVMSNIGFLSNLGTLNIVKQLVALNQKTMFQHAFWPTPHAMAYFQ